MALHSAFAWQCSMCECSAAIVTQRTPLMIVATNTDLCVLMNTSTRNYHAYSFICSSSHYGSIHYLAYSLQLREIQFI